MKTLKEEWKTIEGFEYYEVSNLGRIKSLERKKWIEPQLKTEGYYRTITEKILKPAKNSVGYPMVNLYDTNISCKMTTKYVHRLVIEHFVDNTDPYDKYGEIRDECDHKDMKKTNCRSNNLKWVSRKENMMLASDTIKDSIPRGEDHWASKLKNHQVLEIRKLYNNEDYNITELTKIFDSSHKTISNIINYKSWTHLI